MTDEKKTDQTTRTENDERKIGELPPKEVSDRDAQSVKGGMISQKFDKK